MLSLAVPVDADAGIGRPQVDADGVGLLLLVSRHPASAVGPASSGSQRTTTTIGPLPLLPVSKRVGMTRFVKSTIVTACLATRP